MKKYFVILIFLFASCKEKKEVTYTIGVTEYFNVKHGRHGRFYHDAVQSDRIKKMTVNGKEKEFKLLVVRYDSTFTSNTGIDSVEIEIIQNTK